MHNFIPQNPGKQKTVDIFIIFSLFLTNRPFLWTTDANSTSSDDRVASQQIQKCRPQIFFTRFKISDRVRFHWWEGKWGVMVMLPVMYHTNFKVIRNQPLTSCFVSQLITFLLMIRFFLLHCVIIYKTKVKIALMEFSINVDIIKS